MGGSDDKESGGGYSLSRGSFIPEVILIGNVYNE